MQKFMFLQNPTYNPAQSPKILYIAPIISLARTSIAIAALCRDARPCVSTAPEKSYGTRRETQNVASLPISPVCNNFTTKKEQNSYYIL